MYFAAAAISITFAAVSGAYHLDMQQCWRSFFVKKMFLCRNKLSSGNPRAAYSCCAVSGRGAGRGRTTYQGMLRNPLVSPDILGVPPVPDLVPARQSCGDYPLFTPAVRILRRADGGRGRLVDYGRVTRHDPILTLVLVGIALGRCAERGYR